MNVTMKGMLGDQVLRNGLSIVPFDQTRNPPMKLLTGSNSSLNHGLKQAKNGSVFSAMNKLVKDKLNFGARILKVGNVEKLFRRIFNLREGERLLKASKCCLYTTAGPISGRIFISTDRLAFCSDTPIAKYNSPEGELHRFHYKVTIPLCKIKQAKVNQNEIKPSQKYVQVTTSDDFEFWFTGFVNHKRTFNCLQQAVSKTLS